MLHLSLSFERNGEMDREIMRERETDRGRGSRRDAEETIVRVILYLKTVSPRSGNGGWCQMVLTAGAGAAAAAATLSLAPRTCKIY